MAGDSRVEPDWALGGPAHPGGGHRRLGRHRGRQAVRGQGRPVRPGLGSAGRRPPGGGGGPGLRGRPGRGGQHGDPGVDPAGRRTGRHPLLDQPGGHRDHRGAGRPGRAGRRGHRGRAGPGVPPVRLRGHGARGRAPPGRARGARGRQTCWPTCSGRRASTSGPGWTIESVRHDGQRFAVSLAGVDPLVVDRLLVATGRRPDLAQLNVASVGLDESARAIPVDDHLRVVGAEGIWAVGDVTGKGAFTHVSMYQADIVVNDILGKEVVAGRLPGGAPRHLHRPGDRVGRPHRARRPRPGDSPCGSG